MLRQLPQWRAKYSLVVVAGVFVTVSTFLQGLIYNVLAGRVSWGTYSLRNQYKDSLETEL